ncbi:MAG TPA: hypothetical protein VHJ69_10375 [Gemmatimonadales bacterium]|jgi:hypothetical protein|nr:hypothetical protein [Gemmatimonadales bacterium]
MRTGALFAVIASAHATDFACTTAAGFGPGGFPVTGFVLFIEIGDGCWQLRGDDGRTFELRPDQAPAAMLVDGARVSVVVEVRQDLTAICGVGRIADVERVDSVTLPKSKP